MGCRQAGQGGRAQGLAASSRVPPAAAGQGIDHLIPDGLLGAVPASSSCEELRPVRLRGPPLTDGGRQRVHSGSFDPAPPARCSALLAGTKEGRDREEDGFLVGSGVACVGHGDGGARRAHTQYTRSDAFFYNQLSAPLPSLCLGW